MARKKKSVPPSLFQTVRKKLYAIDPVWYLFLLIFLIGMYLRFYHIQDIVSFGWDQARDAWTVRDIILGKWTLIGPKTGVGQFHLGPLYYYFLVPFFYVFHLDPMGSMYFNILANSINFFLIFWVARKLFSNFVAVFALALYACSHYLIGINQIPWNVTLMPGIAALIVYGITEVYQGNMKWVCILWTLAGFYFHLHFTAIFLPFIILLSFLAVKNKKKVFLFSLLSIPLYLIWFLPNLFYEFQSSHSDYFRLRDFFHYYWIGFHLRFLLHRVPDALIQFASILYLQQFSALRYIIPLLFLGVIFFYEKDTKKKILAYFFSLWFLIPLVGFTLYGGPLSEYYFLYTAPIVLFILAYLQEKIITLHWKPLFFLLVTGSVFFWGWYLYGNTKELWIKPTYGGLHKQKDEVQQAIQNGKKIQYNEGDITAYLYEVETTPSTE